MKKLLVVIASLAVCFLAVLSCGKEPKPDTPTTPDTPSGPTVVHVEKVSVDVSTAELTVGGSQTIQVTITPANASDKGVTFTSSDENVVKVDSNGKITAIGPGTATVTVTTKDGSKTATITVTVKEDAPPTVAVTGIEIENDEMNLLEGDQVFARVRVLPEDATNKEFTCDASDPSIFRIDKIEKKDGYDAVFLTGLKEGTATLTVTTEDGGHSASVPVNVNKLIEITALTLSSSSLEMAIDETATLTATIEPENATVKFVTWNSSDPEVAGFNVVDFSDPNTIKVTAFKAGTATITATSLDGKKTATCEVTVLETPSEPVAVTGISLDQTNLTLEAGSRVTLVATVKPANATNKNLSWRSSNEGCCSVDSEGNVTAIKKGIATIIVSPVENPSIKASCRIEVTPPPVPVTGIMFDEHYSEFDIEVIEGERFGLRVYVLPADATNKEITVSVSDPSIINPIGTAHGDDYDYISAGFEALKEGKVTVTATSVEGGYSASIDVTVLKYVPVESIYFDKTSVTIKQGENVQLNFAVLPDNASYKVLDWSSTNPEVAVAAGANPEFKRIWGLSPGTTTITATSRVKDIKTATCEVTVLPATVAATGVTLDKSSLTMNVGGTYTLNATVLPEGVSNKNVTWRSSAPEIATVNSSGKVTAKAVGNATITVKTEDGGFEKTCAVEVQKAFHFEMSQDESSAYSVYDSYTYIIGSNDGTYGDTMHFNVINGNNRWFIDTEKSHYKITVLSNDGCIQPTIETNYSRYYFLVTFKKNGHAKIRLTYDNGEGVTLSQDFSFTVYLDGTKKWKLMKNFKNSATFEEYTGGNLHVQYVSNGHIYFKVVNRSNGTNVQDLDSSHYMVRSIWNNGAVDPVIHPQNNLGTCYMFFYYLKKDTAYIEASYTDGESMISTGPILMYMDQ